MPLYTWVFLAWLTGALGMVALLLAQYRRVTVKLHGAETVSAPNLLALPLFWLWVRVGAGCGLAFPNSVTRLSA